jgi:hypothetical protein
VGARLDIESGTGSWGVKIVFEIVKGVLRRGPFRARQSGHSWVEWRLWSWGVMVMWEGPDTGKQSLASGTRRRVHRRGRREECSPRRDTAGHGGVGALALLEPLKAAIRVVAPGSGDFDATGRSLPRTMPISPLGSESIHATRLRVGGLGR